MSWQEGELSERIPGMTGQMWRRGNCSLLLHRRRILITGTLMMVTVLLGALALTIGSFPLTVPDVFGILFGFGNGGTGERIVMNIRLPRLLTGILAGACLGVSGAVFQSIARNALGSPDVIGFTTGAATGAIAQIVLFQAGPAQVAIGAIMGGILTALIVYLLSRKDGITGGYRLVLTGIGVGAMLAAVNGLMLVRGNLDDAVTANLWLAGSLNARNWLHIWPVLAGTLLLVPLVAVNAWKLTQMEMGDDLARQLGVNVERTRLLLIFLAVLLAALATGAAGPIAFVALAAPQLAKRLTRSTALPVLSAAAMGACLLVLADLLTQLLPGNLVLPIGRMTGVIGGIYLIWLLVRSEQV